MTVVRERANRGEIFDRLAQLLGTEADQVTARIVELIRASQNQQAIEMLKAFDAKIGGVGLHSMQPNTKLPGPYRSLSYVFMTLRTCDAEEHSRRIVESVCQNIENVLKKMVRLGLFERMQSDSIPLGSLLRTIKNRIRRTLYSDLVWLNDEVYTFAKHENDFNDRDEPELEHYFELDEAIAVYFIARKLVVELSKLANPAIVQSWATEA